ncbi:STAS domain-containing protein [Vulcanimicrobium alpinum]|uniref:STAS domain-containing protein n=1 Tax=Vulcanimicrobium alpinum TaxID=3016050 RepID=UPI00295EA81A|nr:STAS domain-containing protein [Vulcanimicrobium alpinum]
MSGRSSLTVIALGGELDIARRAEIAAALQVDGPGPGILVDLSEVTYADSTIIAELLRFRDATRREGRAVATLIGRPQFARILAYAGLAEAFRVFDDRGAALTFLAEAGR